ncbi:MAG: HNH endonuclease [Calothrix sp. SM1_5_4]|nr:HNH endonuclease [Calothrix sp. SM1_5_4]
MVRPYAGGVHSRAGEIQIDHMVPLKNAYVSGAWAWDYQRRCAYANFLGNSYHLIAVSGRENMSKGDRTPADWLPSNRGFVCTYLKAWLSVKLVWRLIMNPRESDAIKTAFREHGCDPKIFKLRQSELESQRRIMLDSLAACRP